MKARRAVMLPIFMVMLHGLSAFAQQGTTEQPEFRKWDAALTIGIFGSNRRNFIRSGSYYGDPLAVAWNLDAGRYLTTHWKADAGVMTTNTRRVWEYAPYYTGQGFAYSQTRVRPTTVSGALTYQFLVNAFAHPYLSSGLALTTLSEERENYSFITPNRVDPVPVVTNQRYVQWRPFVAAGYKSYFNERSFMKSELLFAVHAHGFSHATLRVGVGIDF